MEGGVFSGGRMRVSRLLIVLSVLCSPFARGDPLQHEFLLLPSAQAVGTFDRQSRETQLYDHVAPADALLQGQKGIRLDDLVVELCFGRLPIESAHGLGARQQQKFVLQRVTPRKRRAQHG